MATILPFKSIQTARDAVQRAASQAQTAELIFFPGIRYERHEPVKPQTRRKRRREHEILELPE